MLSQSTEAYDKGEKFRRYQQLASLQEYILISQDQVEHHLRQDENWVSSEFTSLEDILPLLSVEAELSLQQIYRFVEIETEDSL